MWHDGFVSAVPDRTPDRPSGQAGESQLRASDADRQAVVERLREAHAEGRLDLAEFDERAGSAYAARTYAELAGLTADLPVQPVTPTPAWAQEPAAPAPSGSGRALAWRIVGSAWFFASFVNLVIWGIVCIASTSLVYPWWIWVAGPWGAVLLARWLSGRAAGA